jgi:hypothetical protein
MYYFLADDSFPIANRSATLPGKDSGTPRIIINTIETRNHWLIKQLISPTSFKQPAQPQPNPTAADERGSAEPSHSPLGIRGATLHEGYGPQHTCVASLYVRPDQFPSCLPMKIFLFQ